MTVLLSELILHDVVVTLTWIILFHVVVLLSQLIMNHVMVLLILLSQLILHDVIMLTEIILLPVVVLPTQLVMNHVTPAETADSAFGWLCWLSCCLCHCRGTFLRSLAATQWDKKRRSQHLSEARQSSSDDVITSSPQPAEEGSSVLVDEASSEVFLVFIYEIIDQ